MNEYQEALDNLIEIERLNTFKKIGTFYHTNCDIIQELVDKATPKPVVLHYRDHYNTAWGTYLSAVTCPSCKRRLKESKIHAPKYCPECGQHLDYSAFNRGFKY